MDKDVFGERLRNADFDNEFFTLLDDEEINKALATVELWADTYNKDSNGIYIGSFSPGRCKTSLLACIYNRFTAKSYSVNAVAMHDICASSIGRIKESPILLIDDIGIDSFSGYKGDEMNSVLYELINYRYNNNLTTCFSSNYTFKQLTDDRGILRQTVDRIKGLTAGNWITIKGESIRANKNLAEIERKASNADDVISSNLRSNISEMRSSALGYLNSKKANRKASIRSAE